MSAAHHGKAYAEAVAALKARAPIQYCWSCGKELRASAKRGDPQLITLGHYVAVEDGGSLLDPTNHGPQCAPCNYGDGARRTNAKRYGRPFTPTTVATRSYRNDDW